MAKSIALALLHQGRVRAKNDDNLYMLDAAVPQELNASYERSAVTDDALQFYAVTDGMGGTGVGDLAAQTALGILDQYRRRLQAGRFDFSTFARDYIDQTNQAICHLLASYQGLPVGTTLSLLIIEREAAYTISLGNSRVYLYRDGKLYRLTEDHVDLLPDRRRLTRYLGLFQDEDALLAAENLTRTALSKGDVFLLTTDGVTDLIDDETIEAQLASPVAFVQQIRQLQDLVLQAGGRDNLALIGVKVQDPAGSDKAKPDLRWHSRSVVRSGRMARPGPKDSLDRVQPEELPGLHPYRWFRPLILFLFFVLLGLALGKIIFSLPAWLANLLPHS
jgi:protein phosphatase